MKDADSRTRIDKPVPSDQPPVATPQTGRRPEDARDDHARQQRNRKDMGVREDHKTEDMEDKGRGTFP
jgi:hypothetical protein